MGLQWLVSRTRPDLAYSVSRVSALATTYPLQAANLANHVLRYLAGTPKHGLLYAPFSEDCPDVQEIATFTDASYAPRGGASQLGVAVMWAGGVVSWRSSKATLTSMSSCEAELQAGAVGFLLGVGLQSVMESVGIRLTHAILIDNQAALAICDNKQTWRTRHLAVRANALRAYARSGIISIRYVSTTKQAADVLTKQLPTVVLQRILEILGVVGPLR